ncbi:hypothetical protein DDB_G0289567 [Dictyostelium discoideum AX4]|uniref:hypothetical protein n=1 Tax=Dictyostelium discoideum AX4 TaxID=352472 RepID=UPI00004E3ECA|nr:hypothetical protein DDB_G0289567 [Dictyostelium discoideum AX4]EAL62658.1 hypothetical protein DDB_G0289567 [Dictyostelium discoideum AX4]|eukprot:XP_636161.1 hypothetical protein DDB_G0289567 [Dictyostelium discoideum AX4]
MNISKLIFLLISLESVSLSFSIEKAILSFIDVFISKATDNVFWTSICTIEAISWIFLISLSNIPTFVSY